MSTSNIDSNKKFLEYGDPIYKFMVSFMDKYGVMTIDWLGYIFGLNKGGKPLSEQDPDEIIGNFKNLAEAMKDPEIRELIMETIRESEPVLKEAAYSFLSVALASSEFVIKDMIDVACHSDTIDPICGLLKLAENTTKFANDIVESGDGILNTVQDAKQVGERLQNKLEKATDKITSITDKVSNTIENASDQASKLKETASKSVKDVSNSIKNASAAASKLKENASRSIKDVSNSIKDVSNSVKDVSNSVKNASEEASNTVKNVSNAMKGISDKTSNTMKTESDKLMQQGGAKKLKNQKKHNKTIENRINQSITDFLHLKKRKSKKKKTKKIRTKDKSKNRSQNKSKSKSNR